MEEFLIFAAVGFAAQLVDGALGMGFGVVCSTVLLTLGVPPASASASVHASKVFTGAASAISHAAYKNVDFKLLLPLAAGGVVGGVFGAFILTGIEGAVMKPFVVAWLALMGVLILWRAATTRDPPTAPFKQPAPLGVAGGFLDAIGGGGWGPTVTTTLVGAGHAPRYAVGTSNTAELVVAISVSAAFVAALVSGHWREAEGLSEHLTAVGGLVTGGVVAAPMAGWLTKRLPTRGLIWAVGLLVISLAAYQGAQLLGWI